MSKLTKKCERILSALRNQTENKLLMVSSVKKEVDMLAIMNEVSQEPDVYQNIDVFNSCLTDRNGGLFLAELVEHSSTIKGLCLRSNRLSEKTVMALARALATNTSLEALMITRDACASLDVIRGAMVFALRMNPFRSPESTWIISESNSRSYENIYPAIKKEADDLGHPTLFALLSFSLVQ